MTPSDSAHFLATAARAAPSADNSQPLNFSWDGRRFSIDFSPERGRDKLFGALSHPTLLAVGACIENVETARVSLGLNGHWDINAKKMQDAPYATLTIEGTCNSARTPKLPLFERHTNRFPYMPTPIATELLEAISGLAQGNARVITLPRSTDKDALVAYARLAAEARFCTRELHEWLIGSLRFTSAQINGGEGLDIHTLDLPPCGAMFMRFISDWKRMTTLNRFGAYKALAAVETSLLSAAPALLCIVGTVEPNAGIDAGRLLANLWNKLNAEGVAVHPYYVITDQLLRLQSGTVPSSMIERVRKIHEALPRLLGLRTDESLHMVLRIGLPKVDPPRSGRLPLASIYKDLTQA